MCDVVGVSAKQTAAENEITPETNLVSVFFDGRCRWEHRIDLCVTHCSVDVKWFPFDFQKCSLLFDWYGSPTYKLNFTVSGHHDALKIYIPTDEWDLTCT